MNLEAVTCPEVFIVKSSLTQVPSRLDSPIAILETFVEEAPIPK
jgi:hypothetical protein